jgi:hypothetical protein
LTAKSTQRKDEKRINPIKFGNKNDYLTIFVEQGVKF